MGHAAEQEQILDLVRSVHGDTTNLKASECVVAVTEGKIVGCVRVRKLPDGTLKLASLGVYPEYRRYGVGSEVVKKLLSTFTQRPLYLMCFPELEQFYRNNGFVKIAGTDLPPILRVDHDQHVARTGQEVLCMVIR